MELLQLKYFCDAAESENFSKTAKKYFVPASNISQSIKRLENELGVPLFDRKSNRISLNEHGKRFFEKAKTALSLLDDAKSELTPREHFKSIKLSITSNRRIVMKTIEKFKSLYPEVDIVARYYFSKDEAFDLVITPDNPTEWGYSIFYKIPEKICLAISDDNPLSSEKTITSEMLAKQSFVSMDESSNFYRTTMNICSELFFKPHIAIQADDPFYVRKCVEMGLGVAFVPEFSWKGQFAENVVFRNIGEFYRDTYICKNMKCPLEESAEDFAKLLADEIDKELTT